MHREDLAILEAERNTGGQFEGTLPGGGRQRGKGAGTGGYKKRVSGVARGWQQLASPSKEIGFVVDIYSRYLVPR